MANPVIKVKRSSVAGKVPAATQIERGELAINSYDGKVYIVRDQFSTGIGTTTHTVNPWDEYTIGNKIAYAGIASAQQFDGNITGSVNSSGISTFGSNVTFTGRVIANHGVTGNINSSGISTVSGFTFPSSDGSEDQALVTDGSGGLSFKTLGGGGAVGGATSLSVSNTASTQGQTVLSNITRRSAKIIKHINDNKVKAVFSDISVLNDGIMKKVNQQEREDLIRKISKMTVGMDPSTVKKIFEEVEEKNNNEIDPFELAKIKKLIANMFDYQGNPLSQNQSAIPGSAQQMMNQGKEMVNNFKNQAVGKLAKKMSMVNIPKNKLEMFKKVTNAKLQQGGKSKTHKNKNKKKRKTLKLR